MLRLNSSLTSCLSVSSLTPFDCWPLYGLRGVSPGSSGCNWSSGLCCWTQCDPSDHRTPPEEANTERSKYVMTRPASCLCSQHWSWFWNWLQILSRLIATDQQDKFVHHRSLHHSWGGFISTKINPLTASIPIKLLELWCFKWSDGQYLRPRFKYAFNKTVHCPRKYR